MSLLFKKSLKCVVNLIYLIQQNKMWTELNLHLSLKRTMVQWLRRVEFMLVLQKVFGLVLASFVGWTDCTFCWWSNCDRLGHDAKSVCGSDGVTYSSFCELVRTRDCEDKPDLTTRATVFCLPTESKTAIVIFAVIAFFVFMRPPSSVWTPGVAVSRSPVSNSANSAGSRRTANEFTHGNIVNYSTNQDLRGPIRPFFGRTDIGNRSDQNPWTVNPSSRNRGNFSTDQNPEAPIDFSYPWLRVSPSAAMSHGPTDTSLPSYRENRENCSTEQMSPGGPINPFSGRSTASAMSHESPVHLPSEITMNTAAMALGTTQSRLAPPLCSYNPLDPPPTYEEAINIELVSILSR
ncbi:uncharacterized protein [Apostichopus japonicus]|uniref:uncharacterized protein isoform X3 n=1 Tax=Stichopus japonicus TaxID=307972 RepID=UPI003AB1CDE7